MIRLTTALLTMAIGMAISTTAIAQGQGECWWVVCVGFYAGRTMLTASGNLIPVTTLSSDHSTDT